MGEQALSAANSLTGLGAAVFYLVTALIVLSSLAVAFSRNMIYSAFALLGTFLGVAGIYALLASDFIAVVQLMIYVGGILVLILFAVMLTSRIAEVRISNRSLGALPAVALCSALFGLLVWITSETPWRLAPAVKVAPTTAVIGDAFLTEYLLPFEIASVVLLAALIGAVVIARGARRVRAAGTGEEKP